MDAVTSFIYGMSMMFFSMMAWMFWRKGSERLFRLIMLLMLIADAQCLKDLVLFYYKGFDSTEGWYFTSAVDMFIIPFYSFVLMELVKPGWTTWTKAVVLELPLCCFRSCFSFRVPTSIFIFSRYGVPFMASPPSLYSSSSSAGIIASSRSVSPIRRTSTFPGSLPSWAVSSSS